MIKRFKNILYKGMKRIEKPYRTFLLSLMLASTSVCNTFATSQPKIVSGTVKLFQSVSGWLLIIIPVGAGAYVAFNALQKSLTDDDAVIAEKNKHIKNTIIGAIIAECADGLITVILGFYN